MGVLAPLSLLCSVAGLSYPLHRLRSVWWRQAALLLLQAMVLVAPWALPAEFRFSRFSVALVSVLLTIRLWETRRMVLPPPARERFGGFLSYYLMIPDIVFSSTAAEQRRARQQGLLRAVRGSAKGVALLALLAFNASLPQLLDFWVARTFWLLWAAYFAVSGLADGCAALVMCLSGHGAHEMFRAPAAASSPRDFWSRRWNLVFKNAAQRLIFQPLGGARRPARAVAVVFLWSALVHEYLVIAALGATRGHMSLFFALHGAATLAEFFWRRRWPLPRPIAVGLHLGWLVLTAPLFFEPLLEIVSLQELRAW